MTLLGNVTKESRGPEGGPDLGCSDGWGVCFGCFGREAHGLFSPQPGMEPTPPALEGKVLSTGPPGPSLATGHQEGPPLPSLDAHGLFPNSCQKESHYSSGATRADRN